MPLINKALALSRSEARLLMGAFTTLIAMRLALWLLPFSRTQQIAHAIGRWRRRGPQDHAAPADVCRAITIASGFLPGANCLPQALAAQAMLGRRGMVAKLCLGVGKAGGSLSAHAWLEDAEGQCLIGHADFSRLSRLAPPVDLTECVGST